MFDMGSEAWILMLDELAKAGRGAFGSGGGGGTAPRDEL